jgi:chromosome partitioning protein
VLPANRELAGAEVEMVELDNRERRLKDALAKVDADYDFILIDCPPALSLLTLNGLCAAHGVIIPMQCEYYALEGLSDLVNTIKKVHANLNHDLRIIGLLRVMFDPRMTLSQQVSASSSSTSATRSSKPSSRATCAWPKRRPTAFPGVVFDPASKGAQAYIAFGAEMVERIKTM